MCRLDRRHEGKDTSLKLPEISKPLRSMGLTMEPDNGQAKVKFEVNEASSDEARREKVTVRKQESSKSHSPRASWHSGAGQRHACPLRLDPSSQIRETIDPSRRGQPMARCADAAAPLLSASGIPFLRSAPSSPSPLDPVVSIDANVSSIGAHARTPAAGVANVDRLLYDRSGNPRRTMRGAGGFGSARSSSL